MLEQLFNSAIRVKVLQALSRSSNEQYAQEIIRSSGANPANAFRELKKLAVLGVVTIRKRGTKTYYRLDDRSPYYHGLQALLTVDSSVGLLPVTGKLSRAQRERLRGRRWYHQRFDGSPMFIGSIAEAEVRREDRKPAGSEADVRVCFYDERKADWYLDQADIDRGAAAVRELVERDSDGSEHLLASWKEDERIFEEFALKEFPVISLPALSNDQLVQLWQRAYGLGLNRFTSSSVIDHFALGTDEAIRTMLRKEIYGQPRGKTLRESEFTKIFSVATAPVHQSFINQAEIDLLRIALGRSKESIEHYQERYFWARNNYTDANVLSVKFFQDEIRAWRRSRKNLAAMLKSIERTPADNRTKKESLLRRFGLSRQLRALLRASEDFSWWQDERKKATYLNIHVGCRILVEVARRCLGYSLEDLKYAVASEVATILSRRNPSPAELHSRQRGSAIIATRDGYTIMTGRDVELLRRSLLGDERPDDVQDIRGLSACLGRAVGTVKVVGSVTEISKVQSGDVVVAVMTRPDYVPAMKRAAAIVTDEGGITSHAAIVSRELGVPCIIGTKIATKVFKDGDLVEVNANHGWVRKVQA